MAFWLATRRDGQDNDWIQRFDPRFWTVNFPRPMTAAITTPAPDALRIEASFLREGDLAGLIWESEDRLDHPLLRYATSRNYAHTTLSFRWRSAGIVPLDAVNGPTLTLEGRDADGVARVWYVRLWNYAEGTAQDAMITLPFSALASGWAADGDPVHPGDIDRMFISLVAPGYAAGSDVPLPAASDGWAELTAIRAEGHRAMLELGDVIVPPQGLAAATAYDDCTNQTPERVLRNLVQLGYRGSVLHYAGMSHFMRLKPDGPGFSVDVGGDPLCGPARSWHRAFFAECHALDLSPITALSFELLAKHCPADWQQRAWNGDPARTGWVPPSALLSPANRAAMTWLQSVAARFAGLMQEAGVAVRLQIGEPWWWTMDDGRPCLYDSAARTAFGGNPVEIPSLKGALSQPQKALLDAAGALLASATAGLRDAVRSVAGAGGSEVLLLVFLPTVLDPAMPEARRANLPAAWASPTFDRLQVEDYDWLTGGAPAQRRESYALVSARLGYRASDTDYLAGFTTDPGSADQWRAIDAGVDEAQGLGRHEIFVWAHPQICRDGYVRLPQPSEDQTMQPFDDVQFPLALGNDASVAPEFSTSVALTASGHERRNSLWVDARMHFDVGPGVRSDAELGVLIAFFRARRGAARGFRLRDPFDYSSNGMTAPPTASDQLLGTGDGLNTRFALIKRYGEGEAGQPRRITRPVAGSVLISVNGAGRASGWTHADGGWITFTAPPPSGAEVRAGFLFDVPVRFAEDRLDVAGTSFAAGAAPSVPVIEVREAV